MKKMFFVFVVACAAWACSFQVKAQKFAYVDTKYILDKLPEYQAAQKEMDQLSQKWQKEVEDMYTKIDKLYQDYRAEEVLLSEPVKKQRQDQILEEEKKAKDYQNKRFGYDGDLFKMREEKVKPVQDKVFNAVQDVAKEKRMNFIFDKAGSVVLLYTDVTFDYSDLVLAKLGIYK